ncbi:MAG: hypothetical protein ACLT98_01955 [Eggerthellaceae bacterium]
MTVMKGYAGGRLFPRRRPLFGVALTPAQCIHYALTRPRRRQHHGGRDDVGTR